MIRAIAIDDEPLALEVIEIYCDSMPNIALKKVFSNLEKAKKYLNKFPVDVVFLDIKMPKNNGLIFYKSITQDVKVIFTTAYSEFAIEGFNVNATDYLLKPFSKERFAQAILKLEKVINHDTNDKEENTHLSIRADYKLHRVKLSDILYIEAMNDYIKIYIENGKDIVARSTMKNILNMLPKKQYLRIHKSFIVPINSIKTFGKNEISLGYINLPLGSSYKPHLSKVLPQNN